MTGSGGNGFQQSASRASTTFGVLMLVIGAILLLDVGAAIATLVWLAGFGLIISGVGELMLEDKRSAGDWLSAGVAIVGGVFALAWPGATLWVLAVIAGLSLIMMGLAKASFAWMSREMNHHWTWRFAGGAATVLAGLFALAWPGATVLVLAIVLGLRMVMTGLVALSIGRALRHPKMI